MDISLTPQELLDLLVPPMLRLRGPREPLDLDRMTPNDLAGELRARLRQDAGLDATLAEGAQVGKDLLLDDLRAAKQELDRANLMVDERRSELEQLVEAIGKLKARPAWQAEQVIQRAGTQVLDAARIFLLEVGSDAWYDGMRATLRELVSTLGVEVDDEALEQALQPREVALEPTPAPEAVPPAGFEDLVAPAVEPLEAPFVLEPKGEDTSAEVAALADRTVKEYTAEDF